MDAAILIEMAEQIPQVRSSGVPEISHPADPTAGEGEEAQSPMMSARRGEQWTTLQGSFDRDPPGA